MRMIDADKLIKKMTEACPFVLDTNYDSIYGIPIVEAIPIDKPFLKMKYKGYTVYKTEWLKEHIEMEYRVIKGISESKAEAIPVEWIKETIKLAENVQHSKYAEHLRILLEDWEKENGFNR